MGSYLLSIVLTTQKNWEVLIGTIQNIIDNVRDINNVEIILTISESEVEEYLPQISDLLNLTR